MSISAEIQALISRMDDHPEEFVSYDWDAVVNHTEGFVYSQGTRWEHITRVLINTKPSVLFTQEERQAYEERFRKIVRARAKESIVKELVGCERKNELDAAAVYREKQLNLPLGTSNVSASSRPSSLLTTTDVTREALKILRGQTP